MDQTGVASGRQSKFVLGREDDEALNRELRSTAPAAAVGLYFNCAFAGPVILPVAEAVGRGQTEELLFGRGRVTDEVLALGALTELRESLAHLLGADEDEVAITHGTTEGVNVVVWGLDLGRGDRIVTTQLEHRSTLSALYQVSSRRGLALSFADVEWGSREAVLRAVQAELDQPAQLLVISHVTWCTGAVLPIREVVDIAHARGVPVLVDGAHSVGALPVDFHGLGADFYAFTGYKWLCGPEGMGGLLVARPWIDRLATTFTGTLGIDRGRLKPGDALTLVPWASAARYEFGGFSAPLVGGLRAAVEWHRAHSHAIVGRIRELAALCRQRAMAIPDVSIFTPAEQGSGIVCFRHPGVDGAGAVARLQERGVLVRHCVDNDALRWSCGFFNTEDELERSFDILDQLAGA